MIHIVGNAPDSVRYQHGSFVQFLEWERMQKSYQLDVETNVTDWWCDKKLITVQFGSIDGKTQWIIQWSFLSAEAKRKLKTVLEDHSKEKLIHNAMFECIVLRFHDIRITNIYDTMLVEMILYCGEVFNQQEDADEDGETTSGFYALTHLTRRYLLFKMDKTEQMSFGDDVLTESKVLYAAGDVQPLGAIASMQKLQLHQLDLEYVAALENGVVAAYAEITYHGMEISSDKWNKNIDFAVPLLAKAKKDLDDEMMKEPYYSKAVEFGYVSMEDKCTINWNSPVQKKQIVEHFFPFLIDRVSKPVLTRLMKQHDKGQSPFSDERVVPFVKAFRDWNWKFIEEAIVKIDKTWLVNNNFLIPAGETTINWNSPPQVLKLFRVVAPRLASLNEESVHKFNRPIGWKLQKYRECYKLNTTYGPKFLEKYTEPDGKIRTSFNQIVSTGRVSSRRPNMQNIPAKEDLEIPGVASYTRYRNAFVCAPEWRYVSSDFMSQELVIIAYLSKDPVWTEALRKNQDLHSVCADLIYGKQWKDGTEPGCAYYAQMWWSDTDRKWLSDEQYAAEGKPTGYTRQQRKNKCKCKVHKNLRSKIKPIDFGLAYGMSEYKLSADLKISVSEAKSLIDLYFRMFPKIGSLLDHLGQFGVRRGYIQTIAPFFRRRWFPNWKYLHSKIDAHLRGIEHDGNLGAIERASKNMPIQGTAGDMAKLSLLLLYNYIHDNNLSDKVHLVMQVHDQNDTIAVAEFTDEWKKDMDRIMREAALFIIPNGLLGAETTISDVWTK